jgi:hypothetical protein
LSIRERAASISRRSIALSPNLTVKFETNS